VNHLRSTTTSTNDSCTRRKKEARSVHKRAEFAQKVHGLRAKLHNAKRFKEKATMKKT
jgi:ribosome biogenesis protein NSA2